MDGPINPWGLILATLEKPALHPILIALHGNFLTVWFYDSVKTWH